MPCLNKLLQQNPDAPYHPLKRPPPPSPKQSAAIITAIYVAHGLAIDLLGWTDADWTSAGAAAFHALTGVPHPGAAAAGGRRSRSRAKRA